MPLIQTVLVAGAALVISVLVTWKLTTLLRSAGLVDRPNSRSSHQAITPRGGGLGIIAGFAAGLAIAYATGMRLPNKAFLIAFLAVATIGFLDDRLSGLPVAVRLLFQAAAVYVSLSSGAHLERMPLPRPLDFALGSLGPAITLLWILGVINIFNFLDGIDGLAGTQGVIAGTALALYDFGGPMTAAGLAIAAACAGFLVFNWHPAKIFMGDVGSTALGFLFGAMPFQLDASKRGEAVFATAMFLWFFLADGIYTLCCRAWRGEKIWTAHRSHIYQKLVRSGLRHNEVVLIIGALTLLVAVLTLNDVRNPSAVSRWWNLAAAVSGFCCYAALSGSRQSHISPNS